MVNAKQQRKVLKIGGSILSDCAGFVNIGRRIFEDSEKYGQLIVVISAMKGVTDRLIASSMNEGNNLEEAIWNILAKYPALKELIEIKRNIPFLFDQDSGLNLHDNIVTMGERFSALSLSIMLKDMGADSIIADPGDLILLNSDGSLDLEGSTESFWKFQELYDHRILIVPGFYGRTADGKIRILGRGGSDLSAGIIAAVSGAGDLEFWKDVSAVLTGDPTVVHNPQPIISMSKDMLRKITQLGSRILHPSSLDYVDLSRTRVRITGIDPDKKAETEVVFGRVNCVSVIYNGQGSPVETLKGNNIYNGGSSVYVVSDGDPEYIHGLSVRLKSILETFESTSFEKFHLSEGLAIIEGTRNECENIARYLHSQLVPGDNV